MNVPEHARGFRDGIRYATTWLHERAREMNDPWAKAVLNVAADHLGKDGKSNTIEVKAKLLEIALANAAQANAAGQSEGDRGK